MKFDDFIQCCVMLKSLTAQFRQKDTQQQGVVNINYEDVSNFGFSVRFDDPLNMLNSVHISPGAFL